MSEKRRARYGRALLVFYRTHTGEGFSLFLLYSERCWCRPQGTVQGLGIPLGEKTQRASLT